MKSQFKNIAIFGKKNSTIVDDLRKIKIIVEEMGATPLLEESTSERLGCGKGLSLREIGEQANLAIVFGGDGTMLGISRRLARFNFPFIGINAGHLGFITDISAENYEKQLKSILAGEYVLDSRLMLSAELQRNGQTIFRSIALNDIVISRGISGGMIESSISVNDLPMSVQRADGLIVSTPTGSTAYALSVGGPIVHPTIQGMIMVPVAPHTLTNRPIILPADSKIEIIISNIRDGALYYDMQDEVEIQQHDKVIITRYPHSVHFMHPKGSNYYETLQHKLHWNYMPTTLSGDN